MQGHGCGREDNFPSTISGGSLSQACVPFVLVTQPRDAAAGVAPNHVADQAPPVAFSSRSTLRRDGTFK